MLLAPTIHQVNAGKDRPAYASKAIRESYREYIVNQECKQHPVHANVGLAGDGHGRGGRE